VPRSAQDIVDQAERLPKQFEDHEPDHANIRDAKLLRCARVAFQRRAGIERELSPAVHAARDDGQSWAAIKSMLGASGEATRGRHGSPVARG
jgi:hypothetical protein